MLGLFDYTLYSFLDLSGAIAHPLVGSYVFTGQGVGQVLVSMATVQTEHILSTDGITIVTKIKGNNGQLQIQCQQTSNIHKWLLQTYNLVYQSDAQEWAKMTAILRNITDGTSHSIKGISFEKVPDKIYASKGEMVAWNLLAASIVSESPGPTTFGKSIVDKLSGLIS